MPQLAYVDGRILRTGDIGYMDEDGYVFIEDRKKDMILVSGFNVYPNEVEGVAVSHPGVLEVAAVAQPAALAKNAATRATIASPGSPNTAMTGPTALPTIVINPVMVRNWISTKAKTIAGAIISAPI